MINRLIFRSLRFMLTILFVAAFLFNPLIFKTAQPVQANSSLADQAQSMPGLEEPPVANAGLDMVVPPGFQAQFFGSGITAIVQPLKFSWDFDGDEIQDYYSTRDGMTTHIYSEAGIFTATLTVTDTAGMVGKNSIQVVVDPQAADQSYVTNEPVPLQMATATLTPGDGVTEQYVLMINGGGESRFWYDVTFMYDTLINDYQFTPDRIYLLNSGGTDPWGGNPGGMIDGHAGGVASVDAAFNDLAARMDGDDHLFLWITDHGTGYVGNPNVVGYAHLFTEASVDPTDEQDYIERDFKDYGLILDSFNMWYGYVHETIIEVYYRMKYVSHFSDMYFELLGTRSDNDVLLERLYDYALGDTNRNGAIEFTLGETSDYDGDGIPAYNPATGAYDEDEWGSFDTYDEEGPYGVTWLSTTFPGNRPYGLFDAGFDGKLDVDINYHGGTPVIDGTDLDADGIFDGIDANEDGDMDDWISIDEEIALGADRLGDDALAEMVDRLGTATVSVFMLPCFSGGFIDDLTAPNRVISTATGEEAYSYGNLFTELFTGALHRATRYAEPVNSDADGNGQISMLEAFNYAAGNDYYGETPQYDDNGDALGHPFPIPSGGDGDFGSTVYLRSSLVTSNVSIDIRPQSYVNTIDKRSRGEVPVALLSASGFDATSQVDRATLTFGHSGEENSLVWRKPVNIPSCAAGDVNGDGRPDLVCSFSIPKTGFVCGDTRGTLQGKTTAGSAFVGHDNVVIVPCP